MNLDSILEWLSPPPPSIHPGASDDQPVLLMPPLPPYPPLIVYLAVAVILLGCIAKMLWDCFLLHREHFFPTASTDTVTLKLKGWGCSALRVLFYPLSALLRLLKRICDSAVRNSLSNGYHYSSSSTSPYCDRPNSLFCSSPHSSSSTSSPPLPTSLVHTFSVSSPTSPEQMPPAKKNHHSAKSASILKKRNNSGSKNDHQHHHSNQHQQSSPSQVSKLAQPSSLPSNSSPQTPTSTPAPTASASIFSIDLLWCALLLLFVGLLFVPISSRAAIRPSCKCIVFDDTYGKEYGIFTSPDWPVAYDDKIDCLLYTFQAPSDSIVEINFDEFDVQRNEEVG